MVKQLYLNGSFTKEQLLRAALKGKEAWRIQAAELLPNPEIPVQEALDRLEIASLEVALDALTDMWSEGDDGVKV